MIIVRNPLALCTSVHLHVTDDTFAFSLDFV